MNILNSFNQEFLRQGFSVNFSVNIRDGKKVQQNSAESYEDPPVYKKDGRADKSNYSPISIFSNISKKYDR